MDHHDRRGESRASDLPSSAAFDAAGEALRESETRFRSLFDNAAIGIVQASPDGQFLLVNDAICRMLGYRREELLGLHVVDITHPDDRSANAEQLRLAMSGQIKGYALEKRYVRKDGSVLWANLTVTEVLDDAGQPRYVVGIIEDTSQRKAIEEALRQSEADLNRAQLVAQTGSWRMDVRRNELHWSEETYRIFGLAWETRLTYETFLAIVHPDDRESVDQAWKAALRGEPYQVEHRIVVGDQMKWVRETAELEFDSQGTLLGGFGTVQDITDRKRAEVDLAQAKERLELAQKAGRIGTFEWDIATKDTIWTDGLEAVYGERPGVFTGRYEAWRRRVYPEDIERVEQEIQAALAGTAEYNTEYRIRWPDGSIHWVGARGQVDRDEQGRPLRIIGVNADITDRKQAEESLRQAREELELRVHERTAELARANAELRTLNAALAQRAEQLQSLAAQLAEAEEKERRRLARVLHDHLQQLLAAAQLKLGGLRRRSRDESVVSVVDDVVELLNQSIAESKALTVELSPPVLYDRGVPAALQWLAERMAEKFGLRVGVEAEPDVEPCEESMRVFLFQVARELLFNVIKHAQAHGATVRLMHTGDQMLRIEVIDDGVGWDATRQVQGRGTGGGFGLFSIRERLGLLGGSMEIESRPGGGTRVSIVVPNPSPSPAQIPPQTTATEAPR